MVDLLAAEWLKTRTARSTWLIVGVVAVFTGLMVLLAIYFVSVWDSLPPEGRVNSSLGSLPDLLGWILSLCMAVFGTLAITSEYSSGMIRTTFIATPRRGRVLAAKALIVAAVTFVVSEVALVATLLTTSAVIGDRVISGQGPADAGAAALIVAMGLSTTTFALIGLALGAITRSALASVVSLAMVWYIVPIVARLAPGPLERMDRLDRPGRAGRATRGHGQREQRVRGCPRAVGRAGGDDRLCRDSARGRVGGRYPQGRVTCGRIGPLAGVSRAR